ncbi:ankyrin repeat-containing domain protein [Mycena latifolia]|nr:ankyrin repeat-containing domain protein [Mycena latifolia]
MPRSIVFQLSRQSPSPYARLDQCYNTRKGVTPPTSEDLQDILNKLLMELGRTYIVLDALDECKDTTFIVQFISTLQHSSLHLLFTSQHRTEFAVAFKAVTHIILEPETTRDDITRFVESELQTPKLKHWAGHTTEITRKVVEKSNGMFRLAACLLIELSRRKTVRNSDTILAKLPSDLFEIYDRFLQPIHVDDWPGVGILLRWLLFSAERITLPELEDALAFDFRPREHVFQPANRGDYASLVCESLEGLVTVGEAPSTGNEAPAVVALAHASVADYLMSCTFAEKHECDLSLGHSHSFLAQSCEDDSPLQCASKEGHTEIVRLLLEKGANFNAGDDDSPLQLASEAGHTEIVRLLLDKGADVNVGDDESPLHLASEEGHTEIVHLLLEKGADFNAGNDYTPLLLASGNGHTEIVRLLLKKGADINTGNEDTPLQWASTGGHTEIVRLLLEMGADFNAGGNYTPLKLASKEGHTEIVRLLLEMGATGGRTSNSTEPSAS